MPTLLVTGAAGFIGSNFARHWVTTHPDDSVVCVDVLTYAGNRPNLDDIADRIHFLEADIGDGPAMTAALEDHGVDVIRLTDASHGVEVAVVPSIGNRAYEMKVHGKNILFMPVADVGELKKRPGLSGVPFLAPWANRMAEGGFWANGKCTRLIRRWARCGCRRRTSRFTG